MSRVSARVTSVTRYDGSIGRGGAQQADGSSRSSRLERRTSRAAPTEESCLVFSNAHITVNVQRRRRNVACKRQLKTLGSTAWLVHGATLDRLMAAANIEFDETSRKKQPLTNLTIYLAQDDWSVR